jgi:hypothetical protein
MSAAAGPGGCLVGAFPTQEPDGTVPAETPDNGTDSHLETLWSFFLCAPMVGNDQPLLKAVRRRDGETQIKVAFF